MEQRKYKSHGWIYGIDESRMTARIIKGKIRRCKRFKLPEHVYIEGKEYIIDSVEIGAFNHLKTLRHLVIPDSYSYVDEDTFRFVPNLRFVYIGKGVKELNSWHFAVCPNLKPLTIKGKTYSNYERRIIL